MLMPIEGKKTKEVAVKKPATKPRESRRNRLGWFAVSI
jgi:hypothetical protein